MSDRQIRNARIRSTQLGIEDHGVLTAFLHLEYAGSVQGFGGYALDDWREKEGRRVGTAWGMEFIARVLALVGAEKWEDLPGHYVRADCDYSKVHRIGHITEDRWFDPQDIPR